MKPMKASRTVKNSKGRSPLKKIHSIRKSGLSRSPDRMLLSRSSGMSGQSSGMKRLPPPPPVRSAKQPHSRAFGLPPRMPPRKNQPPLSIDRSRGIKRRSEYDKKVLYPRSPSEHRIPSGPSVMHESRNSPHMLPQMYDPPLKKRARRDETSFDDEPFPPSRYSLSRPGTKNHTRVQSESQQRSSSSSATRDYGQDSNRNRGRPVYESCHDGYTAPLPSGPPPRDKGMISSDLSYQQRDQFPPLKRGREQQSSDAYMMEKCKNYGLTLDERFRTVSSDSARARAEQHTQYNREELENITIDIKRGMREYSPTIRRIIDPSEVKPVRRAGEGHRPIFDREEIKQSSRDLREDAHFEQRMYSRGSGHYSFNYKDIENYEITRHKFDGYHVPTLQSEGLYTLNEKWQRMDKKSEIVVDKEDRGKNFPDHSRGVGDYEKKYGSRSLSADRDFRLENEHRSRAPYETDMRKPLMAPVVEPRHKEGPYHVERHGIDRRGTEREPHNESRSWYNTEPRHQSDISISRGRDRSGDNRERARSPRPTWTDDRYYDRSHPREEKSPSMTHKSGRPKYPYSEKPPVIPRDSSYNEYDSRESLRNVRSFANRGSRSFRGRSNRGRLPKTGGTRGFRGRNLYQIGVSSRGRGFPPRRKSPGLYQID